MDKKRRNRSRTKNRKVNAKNKRNYIKTVSTLLIIIGIFIALYVVRAVINSIWVNFSNNDNLISYESDTNTNSENINTDENKPLEDATFTLAVTGDIMCHNSQYEDAFDASTKTYDFSYVFEDVKPYIQTADIAIGNLETTFAGADVGYSSYPTFNTPEALAYDLKDIGFDILTTANNHSLDKGYTGIENTIKYLDDADISHTGTFNSVEAQNTIIYKYTKGVKIAFLSFTYGTNGISVPKGKEYCINLIDKNFIKSQLDIAKEGNPDMICVSMHWGEEYRTTPNKTQEDLADFLFKNGADVILGNHSHVLEPMEHKVITLDDGSSKDCFVIYSLGNFISGQVKQYTKDTAILNLTITKNAQSGKISIDKADYIPLYMYKSSAKTKAYKLLDINKNIAAYEAGDTSFVDKNLYNTLTTELSNVKKILDNKSNN